MIPASRRKMGKQKKLMIIAIIGVIATICTIVVILLFMSGESSLDNKSNNDLTQVHTGEEQETTKGEDNNIEKPPADKSGDEVANKKEYYIDFVDLAVLVNGGGIFDIHIRFPNGEDYVVVSCVELSDIREEGFFVSLDDRENYMLSSARTDVDVYTGTMLYLARREVAMSEVPTADYPWNQFVLGAYGLNDEDKDSMYARRMQLEENLVKFMNQTLNR